MDEISCCRYEPDGAGTGAGVGAGAGIGAEKSRKGKEGPSGGGGVCEGWYPKLKVCVIMGGMAVVVPVKEEG